MNSQQVQDIRLMYEAVYNEELREKANEYNKLDEDLQQNVGKALDAVTKNPVIKTIGKVIAPVGKGRKTPTATSGGYRPVKEDIEQLDEITASMGRRAREYRRKKEQDAHMASMAAHKERMENDPEYRKKHEESRTVHKRAQERSEARRNAEGETQKESYDLFDYILEHLVAEGYADTNKAALAIMANMSEEWKQSIIEELSPEQESRRRDLAKTLYKVGTSGYPGADDSATRKMQKEFIGLQKLKGV